MPYTSTQHHGKSRRRKYGPVKQTAFTAHADTLDRQHEEFMALLSHELLTPLTSILGWAQHARQSDDPAMSAMALEVIERNARRQQRLIDELLELFRFTHGRLTLNPEQVDLWQAVATPAGNISEFDDPQLSLVLEALEEIQQRNAS